jgi:hypothetical protein
MLRETSKLTDQEKQVVSIGTPTDDDAPVDARVG